MTVNKASLSDGKLERDGDWAVGESGSEVFAVSRRCRHQFADLSAGTVDADGCLVCPWHQARYDTSTGAMVSGPKGFLGYHGAVPGLSGAVKLLTRVLPLRIGKTMVKADGSVSITP